MNRLSALRGAFCCCVVFMAAGAEADCSPYEGYASINEVNKESPSKDDPEDFVEVKLLDSSIPASTYSDWEVEICENSSQGCETFSLGSFDDSGLPWLVLKGADANTFYDFAPGFNILLRDGNGDSIDFLDFNADSGDDFQPLADASCDFSFDTVASQSPSGRGVKRISRKPDGTGNWQSVTAQNEEDSESDTNDDVEDDAPSLTVSDATASAGENMVFTLTLSESYSSDLTVSFSTRDGTATAGTDYTSTSGTLTIPAGETTASVSVPTLGESSGGTFQLRLSGTGADDPSISDQLGEGTIAVLALAGFEINTSGADASTCVPQEIGITAVNDEGEVMTDFDRTVFLSTSSGNGNWSDTHEGNPTSDPPQGVLDPGSYDSGSAGYDFSMADDGTVALFLGNAHAETLSISVVDAESGVSSTSSDLTFRENAFVVSVTDTLGSDLIAGREHNFRVAMLRRDPDLGDCAVAQGYSASNIKVWIDRSGSDPGGAAPDIVTDSDSQLLPSSEPSSANVSFPFVDGVGEFQLDASDVGNYSLEFRDDSGDFSDQVISGSSSLLVARPFGFYINVIDNPAAIDADDSVFVVAGENFKVDVSAVAWAPADDANDDGVPDGHDDTDPSNNADLSDNSLLQAFGQEGPPASLVLSAQLNQPLGGADPGLGDGDDSGGDGRILDNFVNGADSTDRVRFDEVGIIEVAAQLTGGDYLGAGAARTARMISRSGYVGRFVPREFELSEAVITPFCNTGDAFTYMQQPFGVRYRLTARNVSGSITTNYRGAFVKLDYRDTNGDGDRESLGSLGLGAVDNTVTGLSGRVAPPPALGSHVEASDFSWSEGIGDLDTPVVFDRDTAPDGPYTSLVLGLLAQDADGVPVLPLDLDTTLDGSDDHRRLGTTELRFGRLRLNDAYGPEVVDLPVSFFTEYWDGTEFVRNVEDSCTLISREAIIYPGGTLADDGNRTVAVGGGTTTGEYANLDTDGVNFLASDADHSFTAPGRGNTGSFEVQIDLVDRRWLRFDWNQNGDYSDDIQMPPATIGFGSYRGHDRIIYWREVLE